MRPHSGPFLSFLAYYMGAPSIRTVSSHRLWGPPQISSFTYYGGLDPYVFFSYYMGAPRIISLHSILGPPDHFLHLLYGAPQVSFFSYNMGAPLRSLSLFTIWAPPPQITFCAYFFGGPSQIIFSLTIWGPSDQFLRLLYGGPLRSVSSLTI